MHNIMASAAEAEYGTIFINAQTDVPIRTTLNEMGCNQVPMTLNVLTPIVGGDKTGGLLGPERVNLVLVPLLVPA